MRISMWGPKSSGKTTYIAMVYGTALKSSTRWVIRPNDIPSTDFVRENINRIRNGEFPITTAYVNEPNYYQYQIRTTNTNTQNEPKATEEKEFLESLVDFIRSPESNNSDSTIKAEEVTVSFADVAGEQFLTENLDHPLWEHLATSDALICLLDPADATDHFDITFQLLQYLWLKLKDRPNGLAKGLLPHYIAFCFSKMDQPEFAQYINKPQELVSFLESRINLDIDKLLLQYVDKHRLKYFTISSMGLNADVQNRTIQKPKDISPINILEPLRWLFLVTGK